MIDTLVQRQRDFFASGATRSISFRKQQLKALRAALQKWEKPLCDALWTDLHKSYEEAFMTEIGLKFRYMPYKMFKLAKRMLAG